MAKKQAGITATTAVVTLSPRPRAHAICRDLVLFKLAHIMWHTLHTSTPCGTFVHVISCLEIHVGRLQHFCLPGTPAPAVAPLRPGMPLVGTLV